MITDIKDIRTLADDEHRTREERGADCGLGMLRMFAFCEWPNTKRRLGGWGPSTPYDMVNNPRKNPRHMVKFARLRAQRGSLFFRSNWRLYARDGRRMLVHEEE